MNLTEEEKNQLAKFQTSSLYRTIQKIVHDVVERSWKMRKSGQTNDETLRNVYTGEGMEAGAVEVLNILNKYSKTI